MPQIHQCVHRFSQYLSHKEIRLIQLFSYHRASYYHIFRLSDRNSFDLIDFAYKLIFILKLACLIIIRLETYKVNVRFVILFYYSTIFADLTVQVCQIQSLDHIHRNLHIQTLFMNVGEKHLYLVNEFHIDAHVQF